MILRRRGVEDAGPAELTLEPVRGVSPRAGGCACPHAQCARSLSATEVDVALEAGTTSPAYRTPSSCTGATARTSRRPVLSATISAHASEVVRASIATAKLRLPRGMAPSRRRQPIIDATMSGKNVPGAMEGDFASGSRNPCSQRGSCLLRRDGAELELRQLAATNAA